MSVEHPSLTNKPTLHRAVETINQLGEEAQRIHETLQAAMEMESLDAITLLANLETRFIEFANKYGAVLDQLKANADADADLIASIRDKVSKL